MTANGIIFILEADCEDPTCSGHGFCVEGSCVCRKGWRGTSCDQMDHEARQCLPDCSGHGEFDLDTQKCICRGHWTGSDCSKGMLNFHQLYTKKLCIQVKCALKPFMWCELYMYKMYFEFNFLLIFVFVFLLFP